MTRRLLAAAAAATLAAGAAGAQTQGVTDDEVVVGAHTDLSGIFAGFGAPSVRAAQIHFDAINEAGGIHGRRIRYVVEDTGYQVPKAVQATNKLVNRDEIFAMLLALGTPHNIASFKLLDRKGIPNVMPVTAARQMLSEPIENKWAGLASYYDGMRALARYMHETEGSSKFCAMYLPTDFGQEVIEGVKAEAEALGVEFLAETTHKPDEVDFVGALSRLREEGCDTVALALGLRQIIATLGTAKKLGWTEGVDFIGSSAAFHTVVAKVPGGVTDGFVVSAGWQDIEGRLDEPAVAEWVETYRAATGSDDLPGTGALLGRMGAETFVRALEAAGRDLTHESFREAMYTLDYYDPIGGLQVDYGPNDHQGGDTIYISRIVDGSWEMIGEVPPATN